jgi:hypothetical protein
MNLPFQRRSVPAARSFSRMRTSLGENIWRNLLPIVQIAQAGALAAAVAIP